MLHPLKGNPGLLCYRADPMLISPAANSKNSAEPTSGQTLRVLQAAASSEYGPFDSAKTCVIFEHCSGLVHLPRHLQGIWARLNYGGAVQGSGYQCPCYRFGNQVVTRKNSDETGRIYANSK